jgi:hypothetical protein
MQPPEFWFSMIVLLLLAVVAFIGVFIFLGRKRVMEDIPTSKIRSAAQGYVELDGIGHFMDGPPIISPVSQSHCLWYDFRIEEYVKSGDKGSWRTLRKGCSDELFELVDDTGKCVIDPDGAKVTPSQSAVWYGRSPHTSRPPRHDSRLGTLLWRGTSVMLPRREGTYRYTEKLLAKGEPVYAIGLFNTVGGVGGDYDLDTDVRELTREWKQDTQTLLARFDSNKDGKIDMEEWETAREAARKEVMKKHAEHRALPPIHVMGDTHDRRRPYLLSAYPQSALINRYHWYAVSLLGTFVLLGIFLAWMLSIRFA